MTATVLFPPEESFQPLFPTLALADAGRRNIDGVLDESGILVFDDKGKETDGMMLFPDEPIVDDEEHGKPGDKDDGDDSINDFKRSVGSCPNQGEGTQAIADQREDIGGDDPEAEDETEVFLAL